MKYYPIHLDIRNRRCLVIGGGSVGTRKVGILLRCGAKVTVVSPDVSPALAGYADSGEIALHRRNYRETDNPG